MKDHEVVESDVLVVGGGIAGLMAAVRARELGANVVVVEKGNTMHSGNGRSGNDHFHCWIPEAHGDLDTYMEEAPAFAHFFGRGVSKKLTRFYFEKTPDFVKLWDSWGLPMKYEGRYEFSGHAFPGRPRTGLRYAGLKQKQVLTEKAVEAGADIMNRVMVVGLLGSADGVAGAVGIHTQEEKLVEFRAKSVCMTTGGLTRLYPSFTPAQFNNRMTPITLTGDGRVMTYQMGGELTGLEFTRRWSGPRYYCRAGKGTWIGVFRGPDDKPIGPFITEPDITYGDSVSDAWPEVYEDMTNACKGPIYSDGRGMSDDELEYFLLWMKHEENTALLKHAEEEGIDFRKNPVEFGTYEVVPEVNLVINEKCETRVKGLYPAGDEAIGGVSGAAVFGWLAGESAAKYARVAPVKVATAQVKEQVEQKERLANEILGRGETGIGWLEANQALNQIMIDYAGRYRSEPMLTAGLSYLRRLKQKSYTLMGAKNQHELGRCFETMNLIDLGELVFQAAIERKETRKTHKRLDCPWSDPRLDGHILVAKQVDGKPAFEYRKVEQY